ncbi:C-glycoside deglycosidase beta subunit domain-containing protein [Raineyella fluvialis]|uniref:C-glycoside deglycosidase beta subunit domain-containing protein n=1 Tax=Raineyella fluvialis TaxID=2662261 RepID=UPI001E315DC6|nr:DUF6379 domain-containing protein [Raineyella fluvialis]
MPTLFMKLPHEDKVLREDALRELTLRDRTVGFTLDIGLNYYRGLPLSAIEKLEITVDGELVPAELILVEFNEKLFQPHELALAWTEFWGSSATCTSRCSTAGSPPAITRSPSGSICATSTCSSAPVRTAWSTVRPPGR